MTEEEYIQIQIKNSPGWYLVGKLEWNNPNYHEAPTDIFGSADFLWVAQKNEHYYYSIGINPNYGDQVKSKNKMEIITILKYLVCSSYVAFGHTNKEGKTPIQYIPSGVRLKGMKEYILREEKIEI